MPQLLLLLLLLLPFVYNKLSYYYFFFFHPFHSCTFQTSPRVSKWFLQLETNTKFAARQRFVFFSFHSIFKTKCYYLCGQYFNRIITVFISYFKHWQVQRYISVHVSLCFRQHIFTKFWAKFSFVCRVETRTIITVNVSWDFDLGRIILGKKYLHQFWAMFSTLLKLLR